MNLNYYRYTLKTYNLKNQQKQSYNNWNPLNSFKTNSYHLYIHYIGTRMASLN